MDNNSVNRSGDDEYKFIDEQDDSSYSSPQHNSSDVINADNNRRRRLFIIIGSIIAIFCLYKLYGLFVSTPHKEPNKIPMPKTQTAAPVSTLQMPASSPSAISKPNLTADLSGLEIKSKAFEQRLADVEQISDNQKVAMQNLQDQISGLSNAIANIQNNLAMLSQQVSNVGQQQRHASKPKKAASQSKISNVPLANYYVKAMIQGRAWLIGNDGATFTIKTGDNLPTYGIVQNIYPDKGIVMTSSGRIIGYKAQDE